MRRLLIPFLYNIRGSLRQGAADSYSILLIGSVLGKYGAVHHPNKPKPISYDNLSEENISSIFEGIACLSFSGTLSVTMAGKPQNCHNSKLREDRCGNALI